MSVYAEKIERGEKKYIYFGYTALVVTSCDVVVSCLYFQVHGLSNIRSAEDRIVNFLIGST